jgi:poly-gamma-glutamate synthesis protein (capsule biosynthesis protein)
VSHATRSSSWSLALLLTLAGCDSFDFGRLFGGEVPPVPSASAPAVPPSAPPAPVRAAELTVVVGGDVDLSHLKGASAADAAAQDYFAEVRVLLEGGLRLVNLVSPLTDARVWRRGGLSAPKAAGELLAQVGIDAISVANGHLWDTKKQGLLDTLGTFGELGLPVAGAGRDRAETYRPAQVLAEGWSVAIFSVTATWPYGALEHHEARDHVADFDADALAKAVEHAKADNDLVLVEVHGGTPLSDRVTPDEAARLAAVAEAGADVVIGNGAGMPKRMAWVGDRPVFFDLGNLVGAGDASQPWTHRGVVARLTFREAERPKIEACPYLIEAGWPARLAGSKRATQERIFRHALERLSAGEGGSRIGKPERYGCMTVEPLAEAPRAAASAR